MNISTIRSSLKTRLGVVTNLNVFDTVPESMQPPCAIVEPADPFITPQETMGRGAGRINFHVHLYVALADWASAQSQLDALLSSTAGDEATSALDALLSTTTVADSALGGAGGLFIEQVGQYGLKQPYGENGGHYLGATVNLYLAISRS